MTWDLAIDFGASFTTAAVSDESDEGARPIKLDGQAVRMPSAVWRYDSEHLLVGRAAVQAGESAPECFEGNIKLLISRESIHLGDRVAVTVLIAAILSFVYEAARQAQGGTAPSRTVLTYPALWGTTGRQQRLREAATIAGVGNVWMLAEPEAAAWNVGDDEVPAGRLIAIYDLGGGTFDAAVLERTEDGYRSAGVPDGDDTIGGQRFDGLILGHFSSRPIGATPEWQALIARASSGARHDYAVLRRRVRELKEALSDDSNAQPLHVPRLDWLESLSREELDELVGDDLRITVTKLAEIIARDDPGGRRLSRVYLTGGASRMPLVSQLIWDRLHLAPLMADDPKLAVALGAVRWLRAQPPRDSTGDSSRAGVSAVERGRLGGVPYQLDKPASRKAGRSNRPAKLSAALSKTKRLPRTTWWAPTWALALAVATTLAVVVAWSLTSAGTPQPTPDPRAAAKSLNQATAGPAPTAVPPVVPASTPNATAVGTAGASSTPEVSGADVRLVQGWLKTLGYLGRVDGVFGGQTQDSLQRFKADHGLPATAELDAATRSALLAALQLRTPPSTPSPRQTITTAIPSAGLSVCGDGRLAAAMAQSIGTAGTLHVTVSLTLIGQGACVLQGYPSLKLVDVTGSPLSSYTIPSGAQVDLITVSPASAASFTFSASNIPSGTSATDCSAAKAVLVTPPGSSVGLTVAAELSACQQGALTTSPVVAGPGGTG